MDYTSPSWHWDAVEDLPKVKDKLKKLEKEFKENHKISVDEFLKKIDAKGYLESTADSETRTKSWREMSRDASKSLRTSLPVFKDSMRFFYRRKIGNIQPP